MFLKKDCNVCHNAHSVSEGLQMKNIGIYIYTENCFSWRNEVF